MSAAALAFGSSKTATFNQQHSFHFLKKCQTKCFFLTCKDDDFCIAKSRSVREWKHFADSSIVRTEVSQPPVAETPSFKKHTGSIAQPYASEQHQQYCQPREEWCERCRGSVASSCSPSWWLSVRSKSYVAICGGRNRTTCVYNRTDINAFNLCVWVCWGGGGVTLRDVTTH